MAGGGRPHPRALLSVESATTGRCHAPPSIARATIRTELESDRGCHHAPKAEPSAAATRSDASQPPSITGRLLPGNSRGGAGAPWRTMSPHVTDTPRPQATSRSTSIGARYFHMHDNLFTRSAKTQMKMALSPDTFLCVLHNH